MPYNITYMWNQKVSHTCGNCKKKKKKKERERQKEKEKKKKKPISQKQKIPLWLPRTEVEEEMWGCRSKGTNLKL